MLYMVTWIPSIYPSHVSIYTSTMDPMGTGLSRNFWHPQFQWITRGIWVSNVKALSVGHMTCCLFSLSDFAAPFLWHRQERQDRRDSRWRPTCGRISGFRRKSHRKPTEIAIYYYLLRYGKAPAAASVPERYKNTIFHAFMENTNTLYTWHIILHQAPHQNSLDANKTIADTVDTSWGLAAKHGYGQVIHGIPCENPNCWDFWMWTAGIGISYGIS
jgi:hypothetical protein